MTTTIRTGGLQGLDGVMVEVEVDLVRGLPAFHLVGLPNTAVRESRERVLAAIRNSGHRLPAGKVTVNLAPADVRKEGSGHDLAIAVAVIAAERRRRGRRAGRGGFLLGELSLFGDVRPVRGLLPIVLDARARGERTVVVPADQVWEARLVPGLEVVGVSTLAEAVSWYLHGSVPACPPVAAEPGRPQPPERDDGLALDPLLARVALIAAAGRHHLLLVGPPGAGKTRLARILMALLPDLDQDEAMEVTRIHSAAGLLRQAGLVTRPPLRAPHHTITTAGLLGGSAALRPGEVTLAHRGVLFLDELSEFSIRTLDALREPLGEGVVRVARVGGQRAFPAGFQLVAATNPCRCGFLGSSVRACRCRPAEVARHQARLSGPLRDRFDLVIDLADGDPAATVRLDRHRMVQDVSAARTILADAARSPASWSLTRRIAALGLTSAAQEVMAGARDPLGLSARGMLRVCRVARTIAALAGSAVVAADHVREALQYRHEALGSWRAAEG